MQRKRKTINFGLINLNQGQVLRAKELIEQRVGISHELGDKIKLSSVLSNMGNVELRLVISRRRGLILNSPSASAANLRRNTRISALSPTWLIYGWVILE